MPDNFGELLKRGLDSLAVAHTELVIERALRYIDLIDHWNQSVNLTAVRNPREMVTRHLLDSYSVAPFVKQKDILDIGSGAGLPGIPLAILNPDQNWQLLDSSGKRVSFMREAVRRLGLENVKVAQARLESFQPENRFSAAIARAFASLSEIADNASHLLLPNSTLWAMKGRFPRAELAELPADFHLVEVHPLEVPGLLEERHLVQLLYNPES